MKFRYFILLVIVIFSFNLFGCQNYEENSKESMSTLTSNPISKLTSKEDEEEAQEESPIENDEIKDVIIIQGTQTDPRDERIKMGTKLGEYSIDLDGDKVEEKIELHTTASRHDDGDMLWDDGQNWLLLVEDQDKYYPLFEEYVQLGGIYFNVWYDSKETPIITVIISAGSHIKLVNYSYNEELQGYKSENIYDESGINFMYSSIPYY